MPPLPGVLTGILNSPGGAMAPPVQGRGLSRNRLLASAAREKWPDFLRAQYGLPAGNASAQPQQGPPIVPLASGIAQQYPLLSALMGGGDIAAGLRNVGSGAAMSRIAPTPQAALPSFVRTLT